MSAFFRFPHIPHLIWLGKRQPRADKILSLSEREAMLAHELVIEEKIDGANLGFSLSPDGDLRVQNRGQYLLPPYTGQFSKLATWLLSREGQMFNALEEHLIVFGEWCAARHSLPYTALPDWWILFDVFDKRTGHFFNTERRDVWAEKAGVVVVHRVASGYFDLDGLKSLLETPSHYRRGSMEGIMLRQEDESWLVKRAKLVRPEFTQGINEHWSRHSIEWNRRVHTHHQNIKKMGDNL